jgi:hypothetical protein
VLVLIGIAFSLAAPSFLPPRDEPGNAVQDLIDSARRMAVRRAETVKLTIHANGDWVIEAGSAAPQTGRLARHPGFSTRLHVSSLGGCALDSGAPSEMRVDPVRCRVQFREE